MSTPRRLRERAIIAHLVIGIIKTVHKSRMPNARGTLGGDVETLLISGMVVIGHAEGKPKTASAISRQLGIPRATVQRKLDGLERRGMIERHSRNLYCMALSDDVDCAFVDQCVHMIRHFAKALDR